MNHKYRDEKNESLEALLKESLTVNPLVNERNIRRSLSSRNKVPNVQPPLIKASQSAHKDKVPPKLIKCPLRNIPLGLEEREKLKPKPVKTSVQKKSSTFDLIEKLKQIDTKTENATFLERANEEINIAYKQLEELQKHIAWKMMNAQEVEDTFSLEEERRKKSSVTDQCNKQLERMQKKYLNKTRVRYKSLQDFENLTLVAEEKKEKEVEVLFAKSGNIKLPGSSTEIFSGGKKPSKILNEQIQDKRTYPSSSQSKSRIFSFESPQNKSIRNEMMQTHGDLSQMKPEDLFREIERNKRSGIETRSESAKIRYLLRPEHHSPNRNPNEYVKKHFSKEPCQKISESIQTGTNRRKQSRVRFEDSKIEESILKLDNFNSSPEDSGSDFDFEEEEKEARARSKQVQDESVQAGHSNLSYFRGRPLLQRKLRKIDDRILVSDEFLESLKRKETEKYREGRKKLNLLLNGGTEKFDDDELVQSVLKSSYLSKEFAPKNGPPKTKPAKKTSAELFETIVNKFRDKLQPNQLANLRGRDWKQYTPMNKLLQDTFYDRVVE